jgi:hypothetical protein
MSPGSAIMPTDVLDMGRKAVGIPKAHLPHAGFCWKNLNEVLNVENKYDYSNLIITPSRKSK